MGLECPFSHSKVYFLVLYCLPQNKEKNENDKILIFEKTLAIYVQFLPFFSQITWILYDIIIDTKHLQVCGQIGHYLICQNGHI